MNILNTTELHTLKWLDGKFNVICISKNLKINELKNNLW